ncbi:hypothetical protein Back2_18140 [Nocardioides baekrokdamisoli]|uniref:Uncharacterized protein n=1 Tax=Nocardioides baekrokdamisoli TaxID=1804624 RepID=A0A3G9IF17_9ACTN|nr:hypothetical protein [Nocardioides baekrokdamisoli]BBH17527.1 hypothetical protein Back2_18140 [Nocardioides baekrokdamisoli]
MTSIAHIETAWARGGVKIGIGRRPDSSQGPRLVLRFAPPELETAPDDFESIDGRLFLADEDARALYEALAEHYGHAENDVRALRRDYDAERSRVDRLVGALIDGVGVLSRNGGQSHG